ncbi:MAG: universal stress protein [Nitrospiraceae bacterium]|nr:universal stress protein [Nitrospiraceae bacterium]
MKKVLIAVDDTKGSKAVLSTFFNLVNPVQEVVLLNVERLEGESLMIDMLGDAELSTLREMVRDSEHKKALDARAGKVLDFYRKEIEESCRASVKTVIREGIPAEEILKAADEEGAELIILGQSRQKGFGRLVGGNVAKDVQQQGKVPVLIAKAASMCEEPYSWRDAYAAVSITTAIIFCMFLLGVILEKGTFLH